MAKRRGKKKSGGRRKQTFNITSALESYLIANVATQAMFRVNPQEFLFNLGNAGARGSNAVTLPEIMRGFSSTVGRTWAANAGGDSLGTVIKYNLDRNNSMGKLVMGVVGIPIAFRVGSKLMSKPRSQVNKAIKQLTGLGVRV